LTGLAKKFLGFAFRAAFSALSFWFSSRRALFSSIALLFKDISLHLRKLQRFKQNKKDSLVKTVLPIRIRIGNTNPDPDPRGSKLPTKK
jgi:hypothetical protein